MTRRLVRITFLFLCAIMGWFFGYIKVPYIESNNSFWVGFVGCIVMIAFVLSLFWLWNNKKVIFLFEKFSMSATSATNKKFTRNAFLLSLIFIALLSFCIFSYYSIQRLNKKLKLAIIELNDVNHNANLEQQKNKILLLLDLINKIDSTKINYQDRPAADRMIDRIVTLSSSLKIHKVWDMENKVFQALSTERGLLLLALLKSKMDSNSFKRIKENVSFYGADLRNADLQGIDLSGIDLKFANLQYANLQKTNLNYSNLRGANMVGVNLNHASLVGANIIGAKLNWAKINEADLQNVNLDSSDLSNATLHKSKLNDATLIRTDLCYSVLTEANLSLCIMVATNILNTNLSKAIFVNADIYQTDLGGAILNDIIIQENWLERLSEMNNYDVNRMFERYQIVRDSIFLQDSIIYRLKLK